MVDTNTKELEKRIEVLEDSLVKINKRLKIINETLSFAARVVNAHHKAIEKIQLIVGIIMPTVEE
jgi:hypothetical protein